MQWSVALGSAFYRGGKAIIRSTTELYAIVFDLSTVFYDVLSAMKRRSGICLLYGRKGVYEECSALSTTELYAIVFDLSTVFYDVLSAMTRSIGSCFL